MKNIYKWGAVAFGISLVSTIVYGQARTPYTRPAYVTTPGAVTAGNVVSNGNTSTQTLNVGTTVSGPRASVLSGVSGDAPSAFSSNDFIVGRDAASGANSGAVFLRYDSTNNQGTIGVLSPGIAWRRMRLRGLDFQFVSPSDQILLGIGSTGIADALSGFNSLAASGNQAFTCTNVGCRLSLGNTGRYLVDDGTNLEFIAPLQATTFEATTASGSALTGGGASGPLLIASNTPDSFTSSTVPAIKLKVNEAINGNDLMFALVDSGDTTRMSFVATNGRLCLGSTCQGTVAAKYFNSTSTVEINSSIATTELNPVKLIAASNYTADTANIVSIYNNGSTQVATFSKDGLLRVNKANAAKPTCNADNRGRLFFLDGGAGVADIMEVCMKEAGGTYGWETVATAAP